MKGEHPVTSYLDEGLDNPAQPETGLRSTKPGGFSLQIPLLTFFLVIALFAVSLVCWQAGQSIERVEHQLEGLRDVARELEVDDPTQFAVVDKVDQWFGENNFEIYVPTGQSYQLCLALDAIDKKGIPNPQSFVCLPAGVHRIEIVYDANGDEPTIEILIDGQTVIEESRPKGWEPRVGSSGGMQFSRNLQFPVAEPVVLFRRRFMERLSNGSVAVPKNPSAGILVWVEPEQTE